MVQVSPSPQLSWQQLPAHAPQVGAHPMLQSFGHDSAVSELAHVLSPQNPLAGGQSPAQFAEVSPPPGLQQLSPHVPVVAAQSAAQVQ
jgi:hypothetical protein